MTSNRDLYRLLPAKDGDADRLNLQHQVFRKVLDGRLLNAPLGERIERVLDIGTGSGIWAAEFAKEHPEAEVTGIDLFEPTTLAPKNCRFLLRDAEGDWEIGPLELDLVHTRMVLLHVKNVSSVLRNAFNHLRSGGYIELQELWNPYQTDEPPGAAEHTCPGMEWSQLRAQAAAKRGIDQSIALKLPEMLLAAGFTDIQVRDDKWPIGPWMEDERSKDIGKMFLDCVRKVILSFAKSVSVGKCEMDEQTLAEKAESASESLGKFRIYGRIRFVWAKKPEGSSDS